MFLKAELLHKLGKKEEANQTFIDFFKKAFRYGIENTIKLYRFIPITTNSIYSISEKAIYLNHPNNWNDPFDCNLYDEAEEHFRRARMTCFSHSSNDEEPWQNILMWGHYANSHKGICLEFEFNFKEGSNYHLHKVEYKDSFNNFEKSNAFKFKAKNWEYENEYRLCYYGEDSDTSNPHKASWEDVGLTLKSIYFGVKTTDEDVELFKKIIKDVDFYRVQKDKKAQFKIAREELKTQDNLLFAKLGINQ